MKALTLWQPWAEAVAARAKPYETRSWGTDYRGPLAIHAAQAFPEESHAQCDKIGWSIGAADTFPRGAIVCTCNLVDCFQLRSRRWWLDERFGIGNRCFKHTEAFKWGIFLPGRFVWVLQNVRRLPEPIYCRGYQQLWNWNEEKPIRYCKRTDLVQLPDGVKEWK